ncbi:MAG: DUF1553 domain-containing protein [Planctomycetes bacterium]|nr:DUF1553 domain-containing protein [Planctomycetota bacterium]
MMLRTLSLAALAFSLGLQSAQADAPPSAALQSLRVYPAKVELIGPRAEQHLGVLGEYTDGQMRELTRGARFTSSNSKVVSVDTAGLLRGLTNGKATVTVEAGEKKVVVPVVVEGADDEAPVSFSREVVPVLTRAGCNQGACHGGQHGRGGFKLSLLGFEPEFDHPQIVQSAEGRRVVLSEPERSILLLKPTLSLEHGGGERFKVGTRPYNLLKRWLEDGAPPPSPRDPTVTAMEVWPTKRVMVPGEEQQIIVRASWSDDRTTDVTDVAQFDALNDAVAAVSPSGRITAKASGQTHVMVRFRGQATVVQVTLPYTHLDRPPDFPTNNVIDEKLKAKWQELGLTPSPQCSDEEFFRRIHLDALGTLPAPEDVKVFLADRSPDKRKKAIDKVLDRPEFVDFWALKWGDLLRINRDAINDKGMWSFHNWVRASLRDGKPLDQMAREIITAEGSTFTQGPANYYRLSVGADNQAETTSMLFLGVRMQCAKCHHHAFEKWSQDDYYGMAAFFVRLGSKNSQEFGLFGRETIIYLRDSGEATHPRKGGVVKPHALDGPITDDLFDRRRKLAEWLTAKENPFFARNFANRFWGYFMGRGLVEPIDDIRSTNPPSNPELLDALAQELIRDKYDLKRFMRTIMNARAYQLSSRSFPGNRADAANTHYARYTVKRLTAEQLADALDFATGTREKYPGLPPGTRAIQLPDTRVRSFLLDVFGRPPRQITCECERTAQPNIAQALHLLNGDFLNRKIILPAGRIEALLKSKASLPTAIEQLYLVTFSRLPQPEELTRAKEWVAKAPSLREGLGDLLWVLVNAREFQFNH